MVEAWSITLDMIFWPLHCKHDKPKTTRQWVEKALRKIMATQTEIVAQLKTAVDTINKIGVETDKSLQLIKDLQDAVGNQTGASPEVEGRGRQGARRSDADAVKR